MKKVLLISAIILLLILSIPFIGNKTIELSLKDNLELLNSFGLEAIEIKTNFSYVATKKSFLFKVKQADKVISYLNMLFETKLSPKSAILIDDAKIGIDVVYNNFFLDDSLSIDIYPYSLSSKFDNELKQTNKKLYKYINNLFENRVFNFHIDYSLLNYGFSSYINDINQSYIFDDKSKLTIILRGATFKEVTNNGNNGVLESDIKELHLETKDFQDEIKLYISNLKSIKYSESKNNMDIDKLSIGIKSNNQLPLEVEAENISLDLSSQVYNQKVDFYTKSYMKKLALKSGKSNILIKELSSELSIDGMSKQVINKITKYDYMSKRTMLELLNSGVIIDIKDISFKDISTQKTKDIGGVKLKSHIDFKENLKLKNDINSSYLDILKNADVKLSLNISKKIYDILSVSYPTLYMAKSFAKSDKDSLFFYLTYIDSNFSINKEGK